MEAAASCYAGVLARANAAAGRGYFGAIGIDGFISIERYPGTGKMVEGTITAFDKSRDYVVELDLRPQVQAGKLGVALEIRAWQEAEARPERPILTAWDPDPLPVGSPGVWMSMWAGGTPGSATFRYFSATCCPPPAAAFSLTPESGVAPLEVVADGSGSAAVGGAEITSYEWEFGDGGTATGATAAHTYTSGGQYLICLTVTDDRGASACATEVVRVGCPCEDVAPWVAADIGDPPWSGGAQRDGGELHVCATGAGFKTRTDEGFFL
ncbi:MAG: PKD domain-containing protein, partial [Planctomycetes bacterium]|nr:PKD domain-containing protein [Planctomycetota bacterium]